MVFRDDNSNDKYDKIEIEKKLLFKWLEVIEKKG